MTGRFGEDLNNTVEENNSVPYADITVRLQVQDEGLVGNSS